MGNKAVFQWFVAFLLLVVTHATQAQSREEDLQLLRRDIVQIDILKPSHYRGYNPVKWLLHGSLDFYQKVLSPQISAGCLYHTSCSRFGRKAIKEFGIIKGVALTADRLGRCNRIAATDIHPVRIGTDGLLHDEPFMYKLSK
jgi:putative component of membrane protein insertase Oxa1/YidC/SpoIIIJ protein YidD